jgi:hypothetical protein
MFTKSIPFPKEHPCLKDGKGKTAAPDRFLDFSFTTKCTVRACTIRAQPAYVDDPPHLRLVRSVNHRPCSRNIDTIQMCMTASSFCTNKVKDSMNSFHCRTHGFGVCNMAYSKVKGRVLRKLARIAL